MVAEMDGPAELIPLLPGAGEVRDPLGVGRPERDADVRIHRLNEATEPPRVVGSPNTSRAARLTSE